MKKKSDKIISSLISSLMVASLVSAAPMSVEAKTNLENEKQQTIEKIREIYENGKVNVKDLKNSKMVNDNLPKVKKTNPEENVRIIVEVDAKALKDYIKPGQTLAEASKDKSLMSKVQEDKLPLKEKIKSINSNIEIRHDYTALINGFSAVVQYKDIEAIKELEGVKHVTIAKKYYPDMNYSKSLTGAEEAWKDYGLDGKGLVVSIIDTGIDYSHKDMNITNSADGKLKKADIDAMQDDKGKWYSGKVPYGYNFADRNDEVKDTTSSMHGMHVAGIVGANCKNEEEIKANKGIKGVAPEAQLLAMKVFSNNPANRGASSDDIVAAIDDSVIHEADVINMSLGSTASFQDPEDAEQKAIKRAVEQGTVVVVSAGNSQYSLAPFRIGGANDTGLVGSPGLAEDSLQVASYENSKAVYPALDAKIDENTEVIPYTISEMPPESVLSGEYELVDCGFGLGYEFEGKDLKGKIALIKRGATTFVEKKLNAQAAGAAGVIIFNKYGDDSLMNMATDDAIKIPGMFISNSNGVKLQSKIATTKVSFSGKVKEIDNVNKDDMSDFTSWGPTPNLDFKPEITAPGGQIWSTINNNKYENMSGTSMSSPHMAGSMALIMQHVNKLEASKTMTPKQKAEFAKKLAVNTAKVMMEDRKVSLDQDKTVEVKTPYSPRRQGAGMVNTPAAIKNNVTVEYKDNEKPVVALKEIGESKTFTLKLHNYGDSSVTYKVEPLNNKILTETDEFLQSDMSYDEEIEGSKVIALSDTITVEPGKDAEVSVTLGIPSNVSTERFAEGFIRFIPQKDGAEDTTVSEIGIPFMGFYGEWDEMSTIDGQMWGKDAIFKYISPKGMSSTVVTENKKGKINFLGYVGDDKDGNPIIDEDKIAISTDEDANTNAIPLLTPLRNIKDLEIQILNEEGKVIRTVAKDSYLTKLVISDPYEDGYRMKTNWKWDGSIYNSAKGRYEKVQDGQYIIRIANRVDYKDAKVQNYDMKVKVDSMSPIIKAAENAVEIKSDGTATLRFKGSDEGIGASGIESFAFLVDGDLYKDANGDILFNNFEKDEEGYNKFNLNLKGDYSQIYIAAIDYAGNIALSPVEAEKQALTMELQKNGNKLEESQLLDGNFDLKISLLGDFVDNTNKIKVLLDGEEYQVVDYNKDQKDVTVNFKDLAAGDHKIAVKLIKVNEEKEEVIAEDGVAIKIQDNVLGLSFENLSSNLMVNETEYTINGALKGIPDVFKINGEDVKVRNLSFSHRIELEANKMNKVTVYAKKGSEEINYAFNVYCDPYAPEINLELPEGVKVSGNRITINVPEETTKYTLKGNVKDDGFGYRFYINGEAIHQVSLDSPNKEKTDFNFEKEFDLSAKTTVINLTAVDEFDNTTTKTVKIVKEIKVNPILEINAIDMKGSYVNGEQFKGGVRVNNKTERATSATLIVGIFNDKNQMVNVAVVSQIVGANSQADIRALLMIPQEGNYTIKCFVWGSLDSMIPLSEVISLPVVKQQTKALELVPATEIKPEEEKTEIEASKVDPAAENPEKPVEPKEEPKEEKPADPKEEKPANPKLEDPKPEEPVNP
ncbi:S8 family serine peptidase [Haloimpatiens sp. FM7315]|uniref:S8 family serine peptidase n=1 Tax=Haloimpatiens sp. FM7315 TaxID=3298609 RepID=UPI00370B4D82